MALQDQLRRIREAWQDGSVFLEPSTQPFVQWIHSAVKYHTPTTERADGREAIYLEIQSIGRPTIVALTSESATAWNVKVDQDAQVAAVIVLNHADVISCDRQLLIYRRQGGYRQLLPESKDHVTRVIEYEIGRKIE